MSDNLYLPVKIAGIEFKNPFFVASGPTTKSVQQLKRIEETGWAAASIKLTIAPSPYINRVPRYAIFKDRNALGFTAEKRLKYEEGLKLVKDAKEVLNELILFANITYAGDEGIRGWVDMAKRFEEAGADVIELNMCCPNMSYNVELSDCDREGCSVRTGASLGQQGEAVAGIVSEIKKTIGIPLFVKLTPEGGRIAHVAKALYEAGADAVGGTANRLGIPPVDLDNPGRAVYHLQDEISMTCYAGAWLKPLALRDTFEIRKVNGPQHRITAAGGIRNYRDALEMIMSGADLLGICSETLISGYGFVEGMVLKIKEYMKKYGYESLADMRDLIVPSIKSAPELTLYDGYARIKEPGLMAPCKAACPLSVPAQAYVRKVAERKFREAYDLIMEKSPLQSVCGWVCNHECEQQCTRAVTGTPIPIREIKKFVIEYAKKKGWQPQYKTFPGNGIKVAVIGSGPAGLSCAHNLNLAGYDVEVFEKAKYLGGMLRCGLPRFRMNHEVLDDEIHMLKSAGIVFKTGTALGEDITVESLKNERFCAVFIATGAQKGVDLGIKGEEAEGVYPALEYLKSFYNGEAGNSGKKVVVIGGGYTAVDAARTAVRSGAEEVYIAYRRTRDEIPASDEEITEAEEEGISVMYLVSPKEILKKDGKVAGITLINHVLGEKDQSNRRRSREVKHTEFTLPCTTVIAALGQKPERSGLEGLKQGGKGFVAIDPSTGATNIEGVFAGGDVTGVESIISAIAEGRKCAVSIDRMLSGDNAVLEYQYIQPSVPPENVLRKTAYFTDDEKIDLAVRDGKQRIRDFGPYTRILTEKEAVSEAERCLRCGCGEGCGICEEICCEFAIEKKDFDMWQIDENKCVACGMCFNRCPNDNIEMVSRNNKV